jgi:hypothetical protein
MHDMRHGLESKTPFFPSSFEPVNYFCLGVTASPRGDFQTPPLHPDLYTGQRPHLSGSKRCYGRSPAVSATEQQPLSASSPDAFWCRSNPKRLYSDRYSRIPATPAAPVSRHSPARSIVTPPSAKTGVPSAARHALRSSSSPTPGTTSTPSTTFPNTGPNKMLSASTARARTTSSTEWHETLTAGSPRPAPRNTSRTCAAVSSPGAAVRCTPSARAATATSSRAFISTRVLVLPCHSSPRTAASTRRASSTCSPAGKSFSRNWIRSTPSAAHKAASRTTQFSR